MELSMFKPSSMDLIRAGLQDLNKARTLFDQLKADDIPDERCAELLSVLAHACDPDVALSNFVDIANAMQSSQRDLKHVIPDNNALKRLVTVLGVSDAMGKFMRFKPQRGGRSSRQLQQPSVQSRATPCTSAQGGRRGPGRTGHARRLQGSGRSGHGLAFQLPEPTGRHHRPGCRGGRPDLHSTDYQPRTVRPRGRGARRRAGHRPSRNRGQRACALHHHRHGQTRRTGTGPTFPTWTSSTWSNRSTRDVDHRTDSRGHRMGIMLQRASASPPSWAWPSRCGRSTAACAGEARRRAGARAFSSHKNYCEQWAENWEFQALLKARPVAGDPDLGQAYMDMTRPFVWSASKPGKLRLRLPENAARGGLIPAP